MDFTKCYVPYTRTKYTKQYKMYAIPYVMSQTM